MYLCSSKFHGIVTGFNFYFYFIFIEHAFWSPLTYLCQNLAYYKIEIKVGKVEDT